MLIVAMNTQGELEAAIGWDEPGGWKDKTVLYGVVGLLIFVLGIYVI